jgi:oligopeptide transport system substrate-binding protein
MTTCHLGSRAAENGALPRAVLRGDPRGVKRCVPLILAAALALGGCARSSTAVAEGDRSGVLLVGNKDEPADLDPCINAAASTARILGSLFEGLVECSDDGQGVVPGAAERWEVSPDGLTYTFHLRGDLRWSNGAPLTSRDFRESFLRIVDPRLASENAGYTYVIKGARDFLAGRLNDVAKVGIRTDGPRTLVLELEHPAPFLLKVLAWDPFYPVYMPSLDAAGGRYQRGGPWERPGVLVSNGPFTLAEWRANAYVRVVRNPNFWDAGRVRISEVRFFPTDDEGAEERSFRSGQLHMTYSLPKTKLETYKAEHPGELHLVPSLRTNFISFNVLKGPFVDPRVRRAFSLAIDRERLVHAVLGDLGEAAHSFVRPGTGGFMPSRRFEFDPREAATLMADAGYPGGRGFPPIELTLNASTGVTLSVAEVLQQMWSKELGVRLELHPLEFKVYLQIAVARDFTILLEGYSPFPDAHDTLSFGVSDEPNNDTGVNDPDYDRAFAAADRELDPVRRQAALDAVEAINGERFYYAPLYFTNRGMLIQPSVRGWHDHAVAPINWRELHLEP